ncbi:MAG: TIGR02281 family clan AA aspartic protease [Verrucomicrobia bacterium]|nr:TIGR02281 family clan AA aspartic protease [Verrucomicrobiota bacterium]
MKNGSLFFSQRRSTFLPFTRFARAVRSLARGLVITGICFASASLCLAETTVKVVGLGPDRADLMVNGLVLRRMQVGQTSPEGVRLIAATREQAEVEVDGKRCTLRRGEGVAASVNLQADQQGHFFTTIRINGVPTQALVDTGASDVAINSAEAKRMRINYTQGRRIIINTANGECPAWQVTLASVQLGDIELHNVQGSVTDGGPEKLKQTLLGMTFLNQLDMQRSGSVMTLKKR